MSQINGILHYSIIIFLCLVQILSVMLFNAQSSTLYSYAQSFFYIVVFLIKVYFFINAALAQHRISYVSIATNNCYQTVQT